MIEVTREKIFDMIQQYGIWVVVNPVSQIIKHYGPEVIMIDGEDIKVYIDPDDPHELRILFLEDFNKKWGYSHKQLTRALKKGNHIKVI